MVRLFDLTAVETRKSKDTTREEFVVPAVPQFTAAIADEFMKLYGPRQLASFIQRCQGSGPWSEVITVTEPFGDGSTKVQYSKFEYELVRLQKRKKHNLAYTEQDEARLNELLNLSTHPDKSDDQLKLMVEEWIIKERARIELPEPMPEFAKVAYEKSFHPIARRKLTERRRKC